MQKFWSCDTLVANVRYILLITEHNGDVAPTKCKIARSLLENLQIQL